MRPDMEALQERMLAACRIHTYVCQIQCPALSEFVRTGYKEDALATRLQVTVLRKPIRAITTLLTRS